MWKTFQLFSILQATAAAAALVSPHLSREEGDRRHVIVKKLWSLVGAFGTTIPFYRELPSTPTPHFAAIGRCRAQPTHTSGALAP